LTSVLLQYLVRTKIRITFKITVVVNGKYFCDPVIIDGRKNCQVMR
jgi:hypothetical protein